MPAEPAFKTLDDHPLWSKTKRGKDCRISDMVRIRGRLDAIEIEDGAWLHDFVVLVAEAPLRLGRRCRLMPHVIVAAHAPVIICAGVKVGGHAQLLAGYYGDDGEFVTAGPILIGTGAVIGPGAIIGPGTTIEQNGQVAANSVIGIDLDGRPSGGSARTI